MSESTNPEPTTPEPTRPGPGASAPDDSARSASSDDARATDPKRGSDEPELATTFAAQLAGAAEKAGLGQIARDETLSSGDILKALGGIRGLAEAILPGLVFLIVYTFAQDLVLALVTSVGLAAVFTVIRLATRTPVTQAFAGLIAVAASAALALWTGRGQDNFVLGLITNAAYVIALLTSLLVKWPLLGLAVGFLMGDGLAWKTDKRKYRAMVLITVCWLALFGLRLVVQLPLFFAGNVEALGVTKLLMGVPLYAILLVVSWLIVRTVYPKTDTAAAR
ncbi:DUF3159 domain-containing protein [Orlajensenia leifsoniae]|uniref:DUF3159 domain-containing protein n=1 Tax=Orlajensenia leifsoniae TaxID=2561933 RepID=A0A4Y9R2T8_9MICO|nr:DUF3159 domain-containing protein [Leifsonia flava]TFV98909.1 DUF3159 domain-containing protein [Leifsonia flava]